MSEEEGDEERDDVWCSGEVQVVAAVGGVLTVEAWGPTRCTGVGADMLHGS